jgi:hypothetical protein
METSPRLPNIDLHAVNTDCSRGLDRSHKFQSNWLLTGWRYAQVAGTRARKQYFLRAVDVFGTLGQTTADLRKYRQRLSTVSTHDTRKSTSQSQSPRETTTQPQPAQTIAWTFHGGFQAVDAKSSVGPTAQTEQPDGTSSVPGSSDIPPEILIEIVASLRIPTGF